MLSIVTLFIRCGQFSSASTRRVFDARVAGQLHESQKDGHRETVRGQSIHVPTYIKRVSVPFASPHLAAVVVIPVEVSYTHSRISTTTDQPTDRHEASPFLFCFFPFFFLVLSPSSGHSHGHESARDTNSQLIKYSKLTTQPDKRHARLGVASMLHQLRGRTAFSLGGCVTGLSGGRLHSSDCPRRAPTGAGASLLQQCAWSWP